MKNKSMESRFVVCGKKCVLTGMMAAGICLMLAGCMTMGPDYTPVTSEAPAQWHADMTDGLTSGTMAPALWWKSLQDDTLSQLESRAVSGNLGVKEARARLLEARALRGASGADFYPSLDSAVSAVGYRTSENGSTHKGAESRLYNAEIDAGWELDIFGGIRRSVEASQAGLESVQEDLKDVLVSLSAEVALSYIDLRTYQARLAAAGANIKTQENTYDLNRSRFEAGMISELAMQQSLYVLEKSRATLPSLESGLVAARNRLCVLTGQQPGTLDTLLNDEKPIPGLPPTVLVGMPAETLRNRPDVRRAERNVAARTALVGVAEANRYPKFRLFGNIGLESLQAGEILSMDSRTWQAGPSIGWNIFSAGKLRQAVAAASARQEQALAQYESTVIKALEEAENVLTAYAKEQNRNARLISAMDAARRAEDLAQAQYRAGLIDFTTVLDTQRTLISLEDEVAQNKGAMAANLVRLYKAFGGGWDTFPDL